MRRLDRRLEVPVVGSALAGVLLAGIVTAVLRQDGDGPPAVTAGPSPSASASPSAAPSPTESPTATVRLPFEDLEGRLLAPEGYEQVDDSSSKLGTLDAAGFARRFAEAADVDDTRTGLAALGYQSGRGHLWVGEGRVYGAVVVRFVNGGGAKRLLEASRDDAAGTFVSSTVPRAVTYVEDVEGFSVQHGLFARGRFVYEVTLTTPEPEADHAEFDRLLLAQRDHAERSDP